MPSLLAIPEYIRFNPNKTDFLAWLLPLPIDKYIKCHYFRIWAAYHKVKIRRRDIDKILAPPTK